MTSAPARRDRLHRDLVLDAAVDLADREGADALSMRTLADRLGVVPMALYKHVAGKDDLLDGMVDRVVAEITEPDAAGWREQLRGRVLSARAAMLRHPWAPGVLATRTTLTPAVLAHLDATLAVFRRGGFDDVLTHHVMHALGSRVWGFTQELYAAPAAPSPPPEVLAALAARFPHVAASAAAVTHDDDTVGGGCDDRFELEFALDLLLDGAERLHREGWHPPPRRPRSP